MPLKDRLAAQIAATGPLTVAQYMTACLHDPKDGYYATRPAIGERGDFVTAPQVSQMFGELIGLWAAEVWGALGEPERVILAEVGPGDGTLMLDALRAARMVPAFMQAAEFWLVEVSAPLQAVQAERLASANPRWTGSLSGLPTDAPLILIANEVLDCLPARQFVRTDAGWAERLVGVGEDGNLGWGLSPPSSSTVQRSETGEEGIGAVLEISAAQTAFASELATRLVTQTGAALLIDYGRDQPGFGDTLQAMRAHQKADPLEAPGECDLTVWANFPAVITAAKTEGAATALLTQVEFLRRLGIERRAAALSSARPDQAEVIARQLHRLTGADQMGELFKACCLYAPADLTIPAFEEG